jgi:hypothetical protein
VTEQQPCQITEYANAAVRWMHQRSLTADSRLDCFETSLKSHWRNSRFLLDARSANDSICSLPQHVSQPSRGARGGLPTCTRTCPPAFRSKA